MRQRTKKRYYNVDQFRNVIVEVFCTPSEVKLTKLKFLPFYLLMFLRG